MPRTLLLAVTLVVTGCGATPALLSPPPVDAGSDAGPVDAGPQVTTPPDAGHDAGPPPPFDAGVPRCTFHDGKVDCEANVTSLQSRDVYWQTPSSPAPDGGYPAVIVYQGSYSPPSSTWGEVASTELYGGFQQARMQALLLERGFTVIAPTALGGVAWQTNTGLLWDFTADKGFIDALLAGVRGGTFGPVDSTRLYATGISSGGYMTSRMAVSYPGVFRALAIHSGSYATCAGYACYVPSTLPEDHPPTRFLHGRNDLTVPLYTAESYVQRLRAQGFSTDLVIDDSAGHEWLAVSPERIVEWFQSH